MRKQYKKRAKEVGASYADSLYRDFKDHPEYRGVNFSWEVFPNLCGRMANSSLFTFFSDDEWEPMTAEQIDKLKGICYSAAVKKSKKLIEHLAIHFQ